MDRRDRDGRRPAGGILAQALDVVGMLGVADDLRQRDLLARNWAAEHPPSMFVGDMTRDHDPSGQRVVDAHPELRSDDPRDRGRLNMTALRVSWDVREGRLPDDARLILGRAAYDLAIQSQAIAEQEARLSGGRPGSTVCEEIVASVGRADGSEVASRIGRASDADVREMSKGDYMWIDADLRRGLAATAIRATRRQSATMAKGPDTGLDVYAVSRVRASGAGR